MSMSIGDIHAAHGSTVIAGSNHVTSCEHAKDDLTRCVDALFITGPYINKQEIRDSTGGIVEGTCEWIRAEDKYRTWLESEESELLCISGGPGTGKTMLSIFLIGEFQGLTQSPSGNLVYQFCNRHDPRRNTATSVLRTWLHDIFTRNPALAKYAAKSMTREGRMEYALGSLGTLWEIFAHTLNDPDLGPLYCVLDGVDECPEGDKKWLVGKIQTLFEYRSRACHQAPNILKIVILSGGIEGVRGSHYMNLDQSSGRGLRALNPGLDYSPIYLGEHQDDVWLVIKARLENHPKVEKFNKHFWRDLGRELYKRSEGLFSWVGFMLDEIASKKSESEIWKTLEKAPRGLRPVYSRLLSQIGDESRLENKDWMFRPKNNDNTYIVLYHRSLADHLLEIDVHDADLNPKIRNFHITPEKTHYEIAKRCLDNLHAWYERTDDVHHGSEFNWEHEANEPSFTM
ncbi:hypothetical protein BDP67DRAFT_616240 [Colletotrichum lupini]|nr:hypothetical protein BDP67DRAFT_616240 [Colletotrichum lupini]